MRRRMLLVFLAIVAGSVGGATFDIPTPVTSKNNQLAFPLYSIVVPADTGWELRRPNDQMQVAVLSLELGPPVVTLFVMQFMKNDVFEERKRSWSARQVADDFRNIEKSIMIEQGVNKGHYQLGEVVMGEEQVGDKNFYTMKYSIAAKTHNQWASLYLYFPREENNSYFIVIHYSETTAPYRDTSTSPHPEFLDTLKSLRVQN